MPRFVTDTVVEVLSERPGLQRVGLTHWERAYVLTQLTGPVAPGDRVVVNTIAVELGLGTGGWHVVHWNLSRDEWSAAGGGHVLKLRYTSLQVDTGVEDPRCEDLAGMPVVVCDLHSQVACVAAGFTATAPGRRLAYVMTDSAALPLALSDLVAELTATGLLATTVTCGQAFGGEHEAVNVTTGLLLAADAGADAAVVGPGPGVVGTRTRFGFTGLEGAAIIDAADARGGRPILCMRWSDADPRPEHRGTSHHTRTVLEEARATPLVPAAEVDLPPLAFDVTTMGRRPDEDRGFFRWAAAAGVLAARLLSG